MKLRSLFAPVQNMTADELNEYMAKNREGTYTLLDVRQVREYKKARIPGSKLIPLPDLTVRMGELDPEKPVIVY